MKYDEYYDMIINIFNDSIKVTDIELRNKIFNTLITWYKENYEMLLIQYFEKEEENAIITLTKEIKQICNLNDYEKIQETYECEQLDELNELSNKIFDLVKQMEKDNNINFSKEDYEIVSNKLNKIEKEFPKIIIEKFKNIKSECLLDLEFLLNKGNVKYYSFRTNNYLKSEN